QVNTHTVRPVVRQKTRSQAQQGNRHGQLGDNRNKPQGKAPTAMTVAQYQHQCAADQRYNHRQNGKVLQPSCHLRTSLPSTWSVPLKPREASRTTKKSAVVAK